MVSAGDQSTNTNVDGPIHPRMLASGKGVLMLVTNRYPVSARKTVPMM